MQWMREQEMGWEPFGPAMGSKRHAALDEHGKIVAWNYGVWSNTHSTRPAGPPGNLLAAQYLAKPFTRRRPKRSRCRKAAAIATRFRFTPFQ